MYLIGLCLTECGLGEPLCCVTERQRLVHSVSDPRWRPRAAGGPLLQRHHGTNVCGARQGKPLQKPGHQQTTGSAESLTPTHTNTVLTQKQLCLHKPTRKSEANF